MPNFYISSDIMKRLYKLSNRDLNNPIIDQFCQKYVDEYIKLEQKQSIKRAIIYFAFMMPVLVFLSLLVLGVIL